VSSGLVGAFSPSSDDEDESSAGALQRLAFRRMDWRVTFFSVTVAEAVVATSGGVGGGFFVSAIKLIM
jgi:hypothetical protein